MGSKASPAGWAEGTLADLAAINPRTPLRPGSVAPYVGMADVGEHQRAIGRTSYREYKSGPKFRNGDVLVARITPCLENGKTAYVDILGDGETGAGSTEFLVLRSYEQVGDPMYLYYLARSTDFRDYAVGRMTGSSGRQRVSADEIRAYRLHYPGLGEQRAIAEVLSSLDDQAEQLVRHQHQLASMADLLFTRLREEALTTSPLGEWVTLDKGTSYSTPELSDDRTDRARTFINLGNFGRGRLPRWDKLKYYTGSFSTRHEAPPGSVVICATDMTSDRAVLGKALLVPDSVPDALVTHHLLTARQKSDSPYRRYATLLAMNHEPSRRFVAEFANGTTVLSLPKDGIERIPVPVVESQRGTEFVNAVEPLWQMIDAARLEVGVLERTRDVLLDELVTGKLRIRDVDDFLDRAGLT